MNIHLLSGFLGSGKTTAIKKACETLLSRGLKVAVITNDQGIQLVDSFVFRNMNIPERRVGNGCFCCNYDKLEEHIRFIGEQNRPDHLFAESVGTCTDLIATVVKPLRKYGSDLRISLTTVVDGRLLEAMIGEDCPFAPEVGYIFFKQLEEAETIIFNKTDIIDPMMQAHLSEWLANKFSSKKLLFQNSLAAVDEWLNHLQAKHTEKAPSLEIDYDTYARGEAVMGYLDQQLDIFSVEGTAEIAAEKLMQKFVHRIKQIGATIGHVKFGINEQQKISFTAFNDEEPLVFSGKRAEKCSMLVNARVQIDPEELNLMMTACISETREEYEVQIIASDAAFFQPGYPRPLHRFD